MEVARIAALCHEVNRAYCFRQRWNEVVASEAGTRVRIVPVEADGIVRQMRLSANAVPLG